MTSSNSADYFGESLATYIAANAAAIGSGLGISAADANNPDRLLAAIVKRIAAWLQADGSSDNFTEIFGYGPGGSPNKIWDLIGRPGQMGYRYWLIYWESAIDFALLVQSLVYEWQTVGGIWQQVGDLQDSPRDPGFLLVSESFDPTGKTILGETHSVERPVIEVWRADLPISPTLILWEGYSSASPIIEVF